MKRLLLFAALLGGLTWPASGRADEIAPEHREVIKKGMDWLVKQQHRDGHWDANGGQYPTSMTALAGMALLMEGSTMREGKYADNIRRAVDWLVDRSQRNGMIGNPNNPTEAGRYMYGHGFSLLFLGSVYGEEEDSERRKKLEDVLTRGVDFCVKAQTPRGGWGYVSSADGGGFDEGSVTITQVQGLRACRNAGIVVPKEGINKAQDYLEKSTTDKGGVIYSLANGGGRAAGGERPPLTAAAIACMFNAGQYDSPLCKKWLNYCKTAIPIGAPGRMGHDEYTHYYYGQALYILGDDGFAKLFPQSKPEERLTWSKYRTAMFEHLKNTQNKNDGSWSGGYIGPIFSTSVYLTILQLDNSTLPIYQR
ncbi:MAG: terpene cyclase/mutase family protein [Planctomycetia bacterium]|nr:terpene cyclase/mutase family protein [Planctomycetia bacterium]